MKTYNNLRDNCNTHFRFSICNKTYTISFIIENYEFTYLCIYEMLGSCSPRKIENVKEQEKIIDAVEFAINNNWIGPQNSMFKG